MTVPDEQAPEPSSSPGFACHFCGATMVVKQTDDAPEEGHPRTMFECPNGHRVVVEIVETFEAVTRRSRER